MSTFKQFLIKTPEYYFLLLSVLAGYTPPFSFNPVFIAFAFILFLQIIFKNKAGGLLIASLVILLSLYMVLAVASEFSHFPVVNFEALKLLFVGLSIVAVNICEAVLMIRKYGVRNEGSTTLTGG